MEGEREEGDMKDTTYPSLTVAQSYVVTLFNRNKRVVKSLGKSFSNYMARCFLGFSASSSMKVQ